MIHPAAKPHDTKKPGGASCHGGPQVDTTGLPLLAIVGCPNVGKSVLFNALTGVYVTVSNYPGTTVELAKGKGHINGNTFGVVDTPGMYQLLPITEEERVARDVLLREQPSTVIHVVDAKNLDRMLPMTLQLIEAGLPVVLVVNLMDEAERLGIAVDASLLERLLGIPVVPTALTAGRGINQLKTVLAGHQTSLPHELSCLGHTKVNYPPVVEEALVGIEEHLHGTYRMSKRAVALLLLQNDSDIVFQVENQETKTDNLLCMAENARARCDQPIQFIIASSRHQTACHMLQSVLKRPEHRITGFRDRLSNVLTNPVTGLPFLLFALFLLYEFVGVFGAQTLVGFLEETVFGAHINPRVDTLLARIIPWASVRDLFGGEFGIITLGVRYAVALILPIVGTFFFAFAIIEDSGYLPRLAMLIDRVFKKLGLNGRAVIPMVLGLGCDTMATVVTRTLETRRERVLSTFLLALAVPCSAQLGVMLGLLGGQPALFALWAVIVTGVFLAVGFLSAQLMPGERPVFYMELPPLRIPSLSNVLVKTYTRMEWYFREVFPLFILASVFIWAGQLTGVFDLAVNALKPLVGVLGLPEESAVAFLFGFFRRDYGAAGLYDLRDVMTNTQILVATTTLTLFVPCIAQFSVTIKEHGWKTALGITVFIFPFAFLVGGILNWLLNIGGVHL